jgi:hypothetical protein
VLKLVPTLFTIREIEGGFVTKAKQVIFTDEEAVDLSGLDEPRQTIDEEIKEEDIEKLFNYEPIQVDEVPRTDTTVVVIPLRDFSCSYGGTWYYFSKGKKQKVSADVRDFLLRNKKQPKIKDIW